jgi:glycerol uptake facilitator-like aquaporin
MVVVYAGGHLSGGHHNPAVTLAVPIGRRIELGMRSRTGSFSPNHGEASL